MEIRNATPLSHLLECNWPPEAAVQEIVLKSSGQFITRHLDALYPHIFAQVSDPEATADVLAYVILGYAPWAAITAYFLGVEPACMWHCATLRPSSCARGMQSASSTQRSRTFASTRRAHMSTAVTRLYFARVSQSSGTRAQQRGAFMVFEPLNLFMLCV